MEKLPSKSDAAPKLSLISTTFASIIGFFVSLSMILPENSKSCDKERVKNTKSKKSFFIFDGL